MEKNGFSIFDQLFEADFGEKAFQLFYQNNDKLILTDIKGPMAGRKQVLTVKIV